MCDIWVKRKVPFICLREYYGYISKEMRGIFVRKCGGGGISAIGIICILVGLFVILICIPTWVWLALVGLAIIVIGIFCMRR
jgi:hypothetical protein